MRLDWDVRQKWLVIQQSLVAFQSYCSRFLLACIFKLFKCDYSLNESHLCCSIICNKFLYLTLD